MKKIYVCVLGSVENNRFFESISDYNLLPSYFCVRQGMSFALNNIVTYDASIFSFSTLDKGYDVTLIKGDKYINLSELLKNDDHYYILKKMRKAHNVFKMFRANSFNWKNLENIKI